MVFPETVLFDFVLLHLEEEMASYVAPAPEPMRCDRWIARSCLQKAVRRGEVEIAQRALANLLEQDRYGVWRHLIVIALEDVGVAGMDTVARVVAASRNRSWRKRMGGEWAVAAFLVRKMAESTHCQAACDLLLRATNCPLLEAARTDAIDAEPAALLAQLSAVDEPLETRALAALALGGGLVEEQQQRDAGAVFDVLAGQGYSSHVVATCAAAWRTARNPMALLLPLVWQRWMAADGCEVRDDQFTRTRMINGVPDYAIDQFTRVGGQVARTYLERDRRLGSILDEAGITRPQQPRAVGDLLFLLEGGLLKGRAVWFDGDTLRLPMRALPNVFKLGGLAATAMAHLQSSSALIVQLRSHYLLPVGRSVAPGTAKSCS